MPTTRLAPSPTGALHLGNARTFLANWLLARQNGWRIILRIEDLDGPRVKKGADQAALEDLRWLGIDWDQGPLYQSARLPLYAAALHHLLHTHQAYPCVCSRSEVNLAASAPHAEDGATVYPGTCRGRFSSIEEAFRQTGRHPAIRFAVPDTPVEFVDAFQGPRRFDVRHDLGDFVIAKADTTPAYQLAVVVDDADMQVTHVVRGDDLIESTPRQILLYHALGLSDRLPHYGHLPLVTGTDGRRLAKRHGDTRLSFYRAQGVSPSRILTLLARWCHIPCPKPPTTAADLLPFFSLANLPRTPIVFTPADDQWLRATGNPEIINS
ncbi:MAG TPA: tRNA glutamyl-Q(34) synthetase GluQRS [Tepidisphaeraceae bacterium]|nr:tRNA glutamyl-Q(34) synthetase GluQRS [Tepidisphaeraceae bacterium]